MIWCLPFSFYFLHILLYPDIEPLDWSFVFFFFFYFWNIYLILSSNPSIELFIFNAYEPPFIYLISGCCFYTGSENLEI